MNEVDEVSSVIFTALKADATLTAALGELVDDAGEPAMFITKLIPKKEINYPQINIYDVNPYPYGQHVRNLLQTVMCRDKNDDNNHVPARDIAARVGTLLNRVEVTSSGKRYYFRSQLLPVIVENDKLFAVPVEVRITKIK